jgi:hypothetical protein
MTCSGSLSAGSSLSVHTQLLDSGGCVMILASLDKEGSCCLTSMAHNQIVEVVSETRMATKQIMRYQYK